MTNVWKTGHVLHEKYSRIFKSFGSQVHVMCVRFFLKVPKSGATCRMFNDKDSVSVDFKCLAIKSYVDYTTFAASQAKNFNTIR